MALEEGYSLWPHIMLGGSLSKFEGTRDTGDGTYTLGRTSHLAILLRCIEQDGTALNIVGHIERTGSNLYIKPYAIWL